jgi:hypothetical protein
MLNRKNNDTKILFWGMGITDWTVVPGKKGKGRVTFRPL